MRIGRPTLASKLSQYAGIGSVTESRKPSQWPEPSSLPKGHPHLGVRNRWCMLGTSDLVADDPVPFRALGEDLVLWRDGDGAAQLMSDRCPHRGARLSVGDVVDGELQCWYHGWRFDPTGQCTSVPTQGGACSLADRTTIDVAYRVEEQAGYLWAWIGESEPAPLVLPDEMTDDSWSTFPETVIWQANWMLALENLVDIMHAPFLHARSITLNGGVTADRVAVTDTAHGFEVSRKNQAGVNFDWVEVVLDPLPYVRLDIPLPPSAGSGPPLRILGFLTPSDNDRTVVHFPRFRQVSGRERKIWRSLYKARLRGTHMHVLNQDKAMLEGMRTVEEARADEHLAQADRPVVHLRRAIDAACADQRQHFGIETELTAVAEPFEEDVTA
ncbi:MAG: Rieske 2Fe-2S domain-containing protein [Acidimicrobiales bacterium]|jgi:phenylpropionate dioxygenase-like ring-hydroxylating dioxygenase large terminal subunit